MNIDKVEQKLNYEVLPLLDDAGTKKAARAVEAALLCIDTQKKICIGLSGALRALMAAEGGEPGDEPSQKAAWARAEEWLGLAQTHKVGARRNPDDRLIAILTAALFDAEDLLQREGYAPHHRTMRKITRAREKLEGRQP